jgi:uncharacterized membrane protein
MKKKNPTLAKTVSWLVVSGILITCTGWFESGSFMVGFMTAVWASIIKTPIYSLHEALWGRVIFKEKPAPTPDIKLFGTVEQLEKVS